MTQEAIVTRLLPGGMAQVAVTRTTACGGSCGSCESCIFQSEMLTEAKNLIKARPGQRVLIETKSSRIFGAALLVYVMPLLFFLLGFVLGSLAGLPEGGCVALSFGFLLLGLGLLVLLERKKKAEDKISFDIVSLL